MPLPTLVIVSGPAGSGKTTLAQRLRPLAQLRIVRCQVAPTIARARAKHRRGEQPSRAAHDDIGHFSVDRSYEQIRLDAPTLDVDTLTGYRPDLDAIAAFASSP